jgi:predicted ATPase
MNFIFVDNYRGFHETLIPIRDVNFLIGENSTGKTSILAILKLLSPTNFWLQNDFDLRQVGLGTFRDVVSIGAKDKTYFSLGIVFDKPQSEFTHTEKGQTPKPPSVDGRGLVAFLMTFTEREGMPKLASLVSYREGNEIRVKYAGNTIKYKCTKRTLDCSAEEFGRSHMQDWINMHKSDKTGYSILKVSRALLQNAPPLILFSYLENEIILSNKKKERNGFEIPAFVHDIAWLAPIRSKPRKTYDEYSLDYSPEGDHTPYLIKKKLDSPSESENFKEFLSKVGEKSGLFRSVHTRNYGRGTTAPFELDVILSKEPLSVNSVGYGVSQALPVIVEVFSRKKGSWFAIQQPEVHLHPKAQAALGEVIFDLAHNDQKRFIIETHSDYMIDRFRICCKKTAATIDAQILFFNRASSGNIVTPILIRADGEYSDELPEGYRDFFIKEELDLLGI